MNHAMRRDLSRMFEDLTACLRARPTCRAFGAKLFLGLVWLDVLAAKFEKTNDMKERRDLIHEFNHGKKTIQKGIARIRKKTCFPKTGSCQKPSTAMSGLRGTHRP